MIRGCIADKSEGKLTTNYSNQTNEKKRLNLSSSKDKNSILGGGRMPEIVYKEESYKIMGACFEVYNLERVKFNCSGSRSASGSSNIPIL